MTSVKPFTPLSAQLRGDYRPPVTKNFKDLNPDKVAAAFYYQEGKERGKLPKLTQATARLRGDYDERNQRLEEFSDTVLRKTDSNFRKSVSEQANLKTPLSVSPSNPENLKENAFKSAINTAMRLFFQNK